MSFTPFELNDRVLNTRMNQFGNEMLSQIAKYSIYDLYLKAGNLMNTQKPTGAGSLVTFANVTETEQLAFTFNYAIPERLIISTDNKYNLVMPFQGLESNRSYIFRYVYKHEGTTIFDITRNAVSTATGNFTVEFQALNQNAVDIIAEANTTVSLQIYVRTIAGTDTQISLLVNDVNALGRLSRNEATAIISADNVLMPDGATPVSSAIGQLAHMAINVKQFGAKGDGITDDTVAIQNAINSLGVAGGAVYFPEKNYLINGTIIIPSNIKLIGNNTKIINNVVTSADGLFNVNGTLFLTKYNLLSNALKGSTLLSFATLPLVEIGGALEISQTNFSEIIKVESIDVDNKTITLESPLMHDYLTSLSALVKKVDLVKNVTVDGFDFEFSTTQDLSPIKLYLSENVLIQNIKGSGFGGSNISIYSSLNFTVKNIKSKNPSNVSPGMGYSVKVHQGSSYGLISNVYSYKTRHCVDIASCSHTISVTNCIGVKNTTQAFALHGAYELNITFEGCKAIACVDGGFTIGNASYFRSGQVNIINCSSYFCDIGFNIAIADNVTIVGCKSYYSKLLNYQIIDGNDIAISSSESVGQASHIQRSTDVLFDVAISKVPTTVDGLWVFNDAKNIRIKGSIKNDMRYGLQIGSTVGGHLSVENVNVNCDIKSNGEFCVLVRSNVTNLTIDNSTLTAVVGGAIFLTAGASKVIIKNNTIKGNITNRIVKNVAIVNNIGAVTLSDNTTTSVVDGIWIENNYAWVI